MKIGQILKNTLIELNNCAWCYVFSFGKKGLALETTVDRKYSRAVKILIAGGLNTIEIYGGQKTKFVVFLDNRIYLRIMSTSPINTDKSLLTDFLKTLELSIHQYVESLSSNWHPSSTPLAQFYIPEKFNKKHGNNMVAYEHSYACEIDIVFSIMATQYHSTIFITTDHHHIKRDNQSINAFIIGELPSVTNFIQMILFDLSPTYYFKLPLLPSSDELKLSKLCVNVLSRYSLFNMPGTIRNQIEEHTMKQIKTWKDMQEFSHKIIIYKTDSDYLGKKDGYSIHPDCKELKVGLVNNEAIHWQEGETGYKLYMLHAPNEIGATRALVTSELLYSNLKVRLPYQSELKEIKAILQNAKAKFEYHFYNDEIIAKIERQIMDSMELPNLEMSPVRHSQ